MFEKKTIINNNTNNNKIVTMITIITKHENCYNNNNFVTKSTISNILGTLDLKNNNAKRVKISQTDHPNCMKIQF